MFECKFASIFPCWRTWSILGAARIHVNPRNVSLPEFFNVVTSCIFRSNGNRKYEVCERDRERDRER